MENFEPEIIRNIVGFHLEEGRILNGLVNKYKVFKTSILIRISDYREECQNN